jgi:hypothetical protein
MCINYLFVFITLINLNNLFATLRPLNFDIIMPTNNMDNLLRIATQLFYDINTLDSGSKANLNQITNRLISLIGAIYLCRYQAQEHPIRQEDLYYLLDLITETNLVFCNLPQQSNLDQNQFVFNLFAQVKRLLMELDLVS